MIIGIAASPAIIIRGLWWEKVVGVLEVVVVVVTEEVGTLVGTFE